MSTENENKKEYNINDEEDYVIVVRKDGTSNGFYPDEVIRDKGQIDARFIAATYVLQDQDAFDYVVDKFRTERLPQIQQSQEDSDEEATDGEKAAE